MIDFEEDYVNVVKYLEKYNPGIAFFLHNQEKKYPGILKAYLGMEKKYPGFIVDEFTAEWKEPVETVVYNYNTGIKNNIYVKNAYIPKKSKHYVEDEVVTEDYFEGKMTSIVINPDFSIVSFWEERYIKIISKLTKNELCDFLIDLSNVMKHYTDRPDEFSGLKLLRETAHSKFMSL